MSDILADAKMDKTALSVGSLDDEFHDREYWLAKTPEERLAAMELMRVVMYGYNPATDRLQRVLTVTELGAD